MDSNQKSPQQFGSLLILALLAPLAGALAGVVSALFRMAIERVARIRDELALSVHLRSVPRSLLFVAFCGLACALAARMTRKYSPFSAGSGIAHVEAVLNSDIPPAPLSLVPLKFLGATLGVGAACCSVRRVPAFRWGRASRIS